MNSFISYVDTVKSKWHVNPAYIIYVQPVDAKSFVNSGACVHIQLGSGTTTHVIDKGEATRSLLKQLGINEG